MLRTDFPMRHDECTKQWEEVRGRLDCKKGTVHVEVTIHIFKGDARHAYASARYGI